MATYSEPCNGIKSNNPKRFFERFDSVPGNKPFKNLIMTRNEYDAEDLVESFCNGLNTEDTIEACNAIIKQAERILEIAEEELESQDEEE